MVVIFIAAICLLGAARAAPHDVENDHPHHAATVPALSSTGMPDSANPTIETAVPIKEHGDMAMHGSAGMDGMDMDMAGMDDDSHAHKHNNASVSAPIPPDQMTYWLWPEHRGLLYAHVSLMIVSWGFLLPVGVCPPDLHHFAISTPLPFPFQ